LWSDDGTLCGSSALLRDDVERLLGHALELEADVRLSIGENGFRVEVRIGEHERLFDARSCEQALRATALVIALAIDPFFEESNTPILEPPVEEAEVQAQDVVRPSEAPLEPSEPSFEPLRITLATDASIEWFALLSPAPLVRGAVGLESSLVHAQLAFTAYDKISAVSSEPGVAADVSEYTGSLRGAFRSSPLEWLTLEPGGEIEVGAAIGQGRGIRVQDAREVIAMWVVARAVLAIDFELIDWLSFRTALAVGGALVRPRFEIDGLGPVLLFGPFSINASAGLLVRFP
jgi:hypothetical protein